MITSVILANIYPKVEQAFTSKETQRKFSAIVASYVDRNVNRLSTAGPSKRTLFSDMERNKVYDLIDFDPKICKAIVKQSNYIKASWKIVNDPFNLVMMMILRYAKLNKLDQINQLAVTYLTLSMYPSLHYKYFKFEPNEAIMQYTINNLSNKFKVKQVGNILQALVDTTALADKTYDKNIRHANDKELTDYINAYKTRLNSLIKKIRDAFEKDYRSGNYMNTERDNEDENDFKTSDSNSLLIQRIVDQVVLKLSVNGPDSRIVDISAKMNQVSVNETRNTLNQLTQNKDESVNIRALCESILYLYLFNGENHVNDLNGSKFLTFCLAVYKKSNTNDENVIKVKSILDTWIEKYSKTYRKTQRVATLNNFRRALYTFFVFTLQRTK
ncbi:MAG: hypothetical protein HXL57_00075 [Solobacterium sp.]|nr:hypothetical protein [Solobacterium sp.]